MEVLKNYRSISFSGWIPSGSRPDGGSTFFKMDRNDFSYLLNNRDILRRKVSRNGHVTDFQVIVSDIMSVSFNKNNIMKLRLV